MRKHHLLLLVLALSGSLHFPLRAENLAQAWRSALAVDPTLEASRWQASAAQRGLYSARAERFPLMTSRASYSVFDNAVSYNVPIPPGVGLPLGAIGSFDINQRDFVLAGVEIVQPLYTFGRISRAIDAAGAEVTAAVANERRTSMDVKLLVAQSFVGVLQGQQLLKIADSTVINLSAHVKDVKNRLDQGVGIENDYLAAQVALSNAQQFALKMRNLLAVARSAFNRSLQRPLDAPVQLEELPEPNNNYALDAVTGQALARRPEIAQLSAKVRSLRGLADSVRASGRPQFFARGGVNYIENRFLDQEIFNGASVVGSWNFFDMGRKSHRAAQLEQSAEAVLRLRSNAESMIHLQVKSAWLDLSTLVERVKVNRASLKSADENLRVSRNRYKQGAGTNTEVLDAQNLRTSTYSNYFRSLYEAVMSEIRLLRAIGDI